MMKQFIDKYLNLAISKKLMVFLIATIFLIFSRINSEEWLIISASYVGSQTIIDGLIEYQKNKNNR